jgi:hypothetical protein
MVVKIIKILFVVYVCAAVYVLVYILTYTLRVVSAGKKEEKKRLYFKEKQRGLWKEKCSAVHSL